MGEVIFHSVTNGAGSKKAGPAALDVLDNFVRSLDPEVRVLLPSEACSRQVLSCSARSNRHRQHFDKAFFTELRIGS